MTEDNDDREGIEPAIWGKSIWETLHFVSLDFPTKPSPQEITRFYAFFEALISVLPCETCREHYEAYWKTHPIDGYLAAGNLKEWVLNLHNAVNVRLNKPTWVMEQVIQKYNPPAQPPPFSLLIPAAHHPRKVTPIHPKPKPPSRPRRNFGAHDLSTALPTGPKKKCKNCGKKN